MTRRTRSWLWATAVVCALAVSAPLAMAALGHFLVRADAPAPADAILVLAGDYTGERVLKGAQLASQGFAPVVLVSGPADFYGRYECDLAIEFAVRRGYPERLFVRLPNRALSTVEEARAIVPELRRRGVHKLLLVTSDFHTRRARSIYRSTAPDIELRVVASQFQGFQPGHWWARRQWQKIFVEEWEKTVANWIGM